MKIVCQDETDTTSVQVHGRTKPHSQNGPLVYRGRISALEFSLSGLSSLIGITGGVLGATVGGPPEFRTHLTTSLLTVAVLFYSIKLPPSSDSHRPTGIQQSALQ